MERIFASFKPGNPGVYNAHDPSDPDSYRSFVDMMIQDTLDYETSVLAGDRNDATAYYYGILPNLSGDDKEYKFSDQVIVQDPNATYEDILDGTDESPNRSSYVSTDVRDSILGMLPSLVRIFGSSENVVSLVPRTEQAIDTAEQGTDYVNFTFWQDNPGFLILYGAFKDAMTVKTGFVKWWTDDTMERQTKTFQNITIEQIQYLLHEGDNVKVVDHGQPNPDGTLSHIVLEFDVVKPMIKVMGVPPEEMRLDRNARTFQTSRIIGHERVVPIDDLVAMGYAREDCLEYLQSTDVHNFTMESQMRNPGRATNTRVPDGVNYGEWYIRADKDGDGFSELRYVCTFGEDHRIVHDEPANRIKFALFSCDPISHTIVGDSVADLTIDIQRIKTNMMRGVLDSLAESINPKTVVNELMVNMDDVMNDDLGAIVRSRGDPSATVAYTATPFAGQAAVPILEMLDGVLQRRTGMSDAAKGLDPKALQSSTMIGVDAVISGQQERIELIARVLAETGFKDLFAGIYNEICENPSEKRTLRIRGKFKEYDTSLFDAASQVEVNATLGKGSDMVRMMALQGIKQDQQQIVGTMGMNNPICGITEMLNTVTDMLELSNIKNVSRYFKTPTPEVLQQIEQAPREPDPMTVAAKAQFEKVKLDGAKAVGDQNIQKQKDTTDANLKREQMIQTKAVDEEKLRLQAIRQEQEYTAKLAEIAQKEADSRRMAERPVSEGS